MQDCNARMSIFIEYAHYKCMLNIIIIIIKCVNVVPQIMHWIEFFKEAGVDEEREKEFVNKFEVNSIFSFFPSDL